MLFQKHLESNSIGNQSGFIPNEKQVHGHNQTIDSSQPSSDSNNRNQISFSNNSFSSLYSMGTKECIYLLGATVLGEGRQGQEPGSNQSETIKKYNQLVDDKK